MPLFNCKGMGQPRGFRARLRGDGSEVRLFGEDLAANGALHEYYDGDTGKGIINKGFQNWNYLALNMIAWLEGRAAIREF